MWALIDNYDSFTYILHHYLLATGNECAVYRNDEITVQQLIEIRPERILISPGPETPLQAGICMEVIDHFHKRIPMLGICLGHQALGMYFGAHLYKTPYPMHGKTSDISHGGHPIFDGISSPFTGMRYHSLAIDQLDGTGLESLAHTADGTIMALAHREHRCIGIQFHPESVGTEVGMRLLQNWAEMWR